jgi:hypothetical protein
MHATPQRVEHWAQAPLVLLCFLWFPDWCKAEIVAHTSLVSHANWKVLPYHEVQNVADAPVDNEDRDQRKIVVRIRPRVEFIPKHAKAKSRNVKRNIHTRAIIAQIVLGTLRDSVVRIISNKVDTVHRENRSQVGTPQTPNPILRSLRHHSASW